MKKQIIAIFLVTALVVLTFASCGKKYKEYVDNSGYTHALVTDEDGNTMRNEEGDILVGVTDEKGNLVTNANGEYETNAITFPNQIVTANTYETQHFKWTVPENLWYFDGDTLYKKDSQILARIYGVEKKKEYHQFMGEYDLKVIDMASAANGAMTYERTLITIESGNEAIRYVYRLKDPSTDTLMETRDEYFIKANDGAFYHVMFIIPAEETDSLNTLDVINMIVFR